MGAVMIACESGGQTRFCIVSSTLGALLDSAGNMPSPYWSTECDRILIFNPPGFKLGRFQNSRTRSANLRNRHTRRLSVPWLTIIIIMLRPVVETGAVDDVEDIKGVKLNAKMRQFVKNGLANED